jgi:hypothetical protein
MQLGCPSQALKLCSREPIQTPVLPTSTPVKPLGVAATTLPCPSATRQVVVSRAALPAPTGSTGLSSSALPPRGSPGRCVSEACFKSISGRRSSAYPGAKSSRSGTSTKCGSA